MSNNVEKNVFEAIESGKVKMRPRWFFIFRTALVIFAGTILLCAIIFLAIFITFIVQQTGGNLALTYGFGGWLIFLKSLPWTLIFTAIVFILLLIILARQRYAFVYQRPLIYALIGVVVLMVIASIVIAETPLYATLNEAAQSPVFFINGIYQYETAPMGSVHRGEVTLIANNGFILQNSSGQTSTVLFAPGTSFDPNTLRAGEEVVVFGGRDQNGFIEAFGIQEIQGFSTSTGGI